MRSRLTALRSRKTCKQGGDAAQPGNVHMGEHDRTAIETALKKLEERYHLVVENVSEVVFVLDDEFRITFINTAWEAATGHRVRTTLGKPLQTYVHPADILILQQNLLYLEKPLSVTRFGLRMVGIDGSVRWMNVFAKHPRMADQSTGAYVGTLTDETERRAVDERVNLAAKVFEQGHEGIMITDDSGVIVDVNAAFTTITGFSKSEVLGRGPNVLKSNVHPPEFYEQMWRELEANGTWRGEVWNRRRNGEVFPELLTISAVRNGDQQLTNYVGIFSDITQIKSHQKALEKIAHFDPLTGLPNRFSLNMQMIKGISMARQHQSCFLVCYLDLDGFKEINDTLGHEAGDQCLIEISRRLGKVIRAHDTVARLGGDEFVILLTGLATEAEASLALGRVLAEVAKPLFLKDAETFVSASIGVASYPEHGDSPDALLRNADFAMYQAKQRGKNQFCMFVDPNAEARPLPESPERDIRKAMAHHEFVLHFQPQINLQTGCVESFETLLRWQHPARGLLYPAEFMPLITSRALQADLDDYVMRHALVHLQQWLGEDINISLAVNLTSARIERGDFVEEVKSLALAHPALCRRVEFEILETAALNDLGSVRDIIAECAGFGIGFAMDDFGTGYSSLSYFSALPLQKLKIDRSFVSNIAEGSRDLAIVKAVIDIARSCNCKVVAEGVETQDHAALLKSVGCDLAQGYWFARPMPAHDVPQWVHDWTARCCPTPGSGLACDAAVPVKIHA